jgi:hypothetical protein
VCLMVGALMAEARRTLTLWAAVASAWLASRSAYAQLPLDAEPDAPLFGAPGQFMISGSSSAGVSYDTFSGSQAQFFNVSFSPGLDYFFARNLAAGVDLAAAYGDNQGYGSDGSLVETKATSFSAGARLGLNVPLARMVSVFPRVTLGFESVHTEESLVSGQSLSIAGNPVGYPTTTRTGPYLVLFVPVLLHPKPHFFIGAGPSFFRDFGSVQGGPNVGGQRTTVAVGALVGGTWGGSMPVMPSLAPGEEQAARPRHFGEEGGVVLDGEIQGSVSSTTYDGTQALTASAAFEPSFDYFVADQLSFGLAPFATSGETDGIDAASRATVKTTATTFGVVPRIGYDVPFGPWASLYVRGGLAFGTTSFDETSPAGENKGSAGYVALQVSAPVLAHPAAHVFVGFGPTLYAELTRTVQYPNGVTVQNRATTLGAALIVGGWL